MTKFIKTVFENQHIGARTYALGSVVEVPERQAADMVKAKHAEFHPGPAFEPEPEPEDEAPAKGKKKGA